MAFPNAVFIGTLAVLYESNAVFLMSVDRDAATEPRKTGWSTVRERDFGAAQVVVGLKALASENLRW